MDFFILIDFNNFFNRFYYANEINCVELYLKFTKHVLEFFSPKWMCNLIDAPNCFRKNKYSEYKSNRKEKPETFNKFREDCLFNLNKFNYPSQSSKSLEAEDLANLFVQNNKNTNFIALSNDKDFLFLDDNNCKIFNYINKRNEEDKYILFEQLTVRHKNFNNKKEFELYLSLTGDASDNIPGVKGIGDKKARKIIEKFKNVENLKNAVTSNKQSDNFMDLVVSNENSLLKEVRNDWNNFLLSLDLITLFNERWEFDLNKYLIN